jgi:hypothetical protein
MAALELVEGPADDDTAEKPKKKASKKAKPAADVKAE